MVKFVILFHTPDDLDHFETGYNTLLGLIENISQIKRRQVNSILGSPTGETTLYRALEIYFDDVEEMNRALNSPVGQTAGGELARSFPAGSFELYFAEVYEESGAHTEVST